jgi:hypothetical protein
LKNVDKIFERVFGKRRGSGAKSKAVKQSR